MKNANSIMKEKAEKTLSSFSLSSEEANNHQYQKEKHIRFQS
jgi:hypothetical protein